MNNFEYVGKWWNDDNIKLIKKNNRVFALYGWNGDKYYNCWECLGDHLVESGKEKFIITPIYKQIKEDNFEIIDYQID
jgi:hypothetical protein